jgi:FKBP-type peptidyl-prolyl cis-trans isomerase 2
MYLKNMLYQLQYEIYYNGQLFLDTKKYKNGVILCTDEVVPLPGLKKILDKEEFEIELKPEEAFGNRDVNLIVKLPKSAIEGNPYPGGYVKIDNLVGKIIAVNSGRVIIDLNHPLAGKTILVKGKIISKHSDKDEIIKIIKDYHDIKDEEELKKHLEFYKI